MIPLSPSSARRRPSAAARARPRPRAARESARTKPRPAPDQPPYMVLADRVIERNAMRGLVALAAGERRAVALGEESEAEADDEEGSGGDCIPRVPRQRERGEPKPERPAAGEPLDEAEPGSEGPRDEHRGSERDQGGQEEREIAVAFAPDRPRRRRARLRRPRRRRRARSAIRRAAATSPRRRGSRWRPLRRAGRARAPGERTRCARGRHPRASRRGRRRSRPRPSRSRARGAVPARASSAHSLTVSSASCQPRAPYQASAPRRGEAGAERQSREQREREEERRGLAADDGKPPSRARLVACARAAPRSAPPGRSSRTRPAARIGRA